MKFKVIFILFNALILFSLVFILFMPYLILGWDYTQSFWAKNWYLAGAFLIILGLLNTYFLTNWRLFSLLEAEKWEALQDYLEARIFVKKHFARQNLRILINTYLVRSQLAKIEDLENHVRSVKPELIYAFAQEFGLPYLLRNDFPRMEAYFSEVLTRPSLQKNEWLNWNLAFSRVLQQKTTEARAGLMALASGAKTPVLWLLSLYLLDSFKQEDETVARVLETRGKAFKARYSRSAWEREMDRSKENLESVLLSKLLRDATDWLYNEVLSKPT